MNLFAVVLLQIVAPTQVAPVLEFPERGLDDPAAYEGYSTRFFQDARRNAVQIYVNQRQGRVVHVWANSANESVGFTVRDTAGRPARLSWGSDVAVVQGTDRTSIIEYTLTAESTPLRIGRVLLGSMRVERDFQYQEGHLRPFDAPVFEQRELRGVLASLEQLGATERLRHLSLLNAGSVDELHARMQPTVEMTTGAATWSTHFEQLSFDGRNRLTVGFTLDRREVDVELRAGTISVTPRSSRPIQVRVRLATDATPLTPLDRTQIFNDGFLRFMERARGEHDRFRRLQRQVRSVELMSYEEKLFAGLPNYATYFGRDMLMAALMMEPVWTAAMSEHVIASVLRKLAPSGEVSHEEALGGQAIRENAAAYNELVAEYVRRRQAGDVGASDSVLAVARGLLENPQAVRENYAMVDDDFQFPILVARYLSDDRVPDAEKRAFLLAPARPDGSESRLAMVLRNLAYVARRAAPYAREPVATNLVSFPQRDSASWSPGSWRDSNAGYAGGRFAMDINVVWVPAALRSVEQIVESFAGLGFTAADLDSVAPAIRDSALQEYVQRPESLRRDVATWQGTARHFWVALGGDEARARIDSKLSWLPVEERAYWQGVLAADTSGVDGVEFLAVSLDGVGQPIPVANSDPATRLFLERSVDLGHQSLRDIRVLLRPYPIGLFIAGLGTLVANDSYASQRVWGSFRRDHYHGPRVVWGREVNLLILGLARQIEATREAAARPDGAALVSYERELETALRQVVEAVEASGLKHNELWTYRIENGRLLPLRYAISTDIQLWNLTDLAVQYELDRVVR